MTAGANRDAGVDDLSSFKAYDIRGRIPDQLNPELARLIAMAYTAEFAPSRVVVGFDIRSSSPELAEAVIGGLTDGGVDVLDIGMCGTEEVYFATFHEGASGGIMVTASHNPRDYNGMKLVREEARPVSETSGLRAIRDRIIEGRLPATAGKEGRRERLDVRPAFVEHVLSYIDRSRLRPLKIVSNPGNGGAGMVVDALSEQLPFELVRVHHEPDGDFPNGIPNPLLPENRRATADAVTENGADFGLAWDGDFDRCFFFDENGRFIEGYYIVGLLAKMLLAKWPGEKIVHDPRLTWATVETVEAAGGTAVQCKSGHAFIKERMREEDALYGGEMSAHHYFRDFSYCDSGMIPWLLLAELVSVSGKSLGELVDEAIDAYPASGEINRTVEDADRLLDDFRTRFGAEACRVEEVDGLSVEFGDWRFNVRKSNTEPLVRLNVESRGDRPLMERKTREILELMGGR